MRHLFITAFLLVMVPREAVLAECSPRQRPQRDSTAALVGVRYGNPQKFSAYAGDVWPVRTANCLEALTRRLDLGFGGGQLSVGYVMSRPRIGLVTLQESLLRTWGSPWKAATNRWYAGTELEWSYLVGARVGWFVPIGGPRPEKNFVSLSAVISF